MASLRSGLIGRAIAASRSPWLHEQEARAQGFPLRYDLFDFDAGGWPDDHLATLLSELVAAGYAGVNVTYPFKQAVIPLLDEVAAGARTVGAVNTVAIRDGRLVGHNTDMDGFRDSVVAGLDGAALGTVWQMGAGGAGLAVASALLSLGVERLLVSDIDPDRARALVDRLGTIYGVDRSIAIQGAPDAGTMIDGLVNTTPMGMAKQPGIPFPAEQVTADRWVADIVYFPLETALLRLARDRGCRTLNGSGMVIAQAARAFHLITGRQADVARMYGSFFADAG